METPKKSGFNWPMLIIGVVVVWALAGLIMPMAIRSKKRPDLTQAFSNARQIGMALLEFETEYGRYPDATTAPLVLKNTKTTLNLQGHSANSCFRQLIAADMAQAESMFYCKTAFSKKPDNRFDTPQTALAPGEVGFGYLLNGRTAFSTKGKPARLLACAPLAFDGKSVSTNRFDPTQLDGYAVLLRIDSSISSPLIDRKTGGLAIGNGKTLLQTGPDTIWGGDITPAIVPPLPKG